MKIRALGSIVMVGGLAALVAASLGACTKHSQTTTADQTASAPATTANTAKTDTAPATELKIQDLKVGTGAVAEPGKLVTVHYVGTLTDGKKFDSSIDRGQTIKFHLCAGAV